MPLQTIPGAVAVETVKRNAYASWPARGAPRSRLEPMAQPAFQPAFTLTPGEAIFTIGSCFARNIELALEQRGFVIPSRDVIKADPEFGSIGHSILNNYGAPSIFNEISWALDPERPFLEEHCFFEVLPGRFVDIHLNRAIRPAPIEVVRARRRAIRGAYAALPSCRVLILTLGLTECWYDAVTGVYINTAPPRSLVKAEPERFELHVLSYQETRDLLERCMELLARHGHPELKVLLTVSPVPLTATHRDQDVMVANAYSKAVLRAVAEEIVSRHPFVDYFPSFESVTLSGREVALDDDNVHPTKPMIELNVRRMLQAYSPGGDDAEAVKRQVAEGRPALTFGLLEHRPDLVEADPELAAAFCDAALRMRRTGPARWAFSLLGDALGEEERRLLAARLAMAEGRPGDAVIALGPRPSKRAHLNVYYGLLTQALVDAGELGAAAAAADAWAQVNVRTPEPHRLIAVARSVAGDIPGADSAFARALELADGEARVSLDYLEHLRRAGRTEEAASLHLRIAPTNPAHRARLERLDVAGENAAVNSPSSETLARPLTVDETAAEDTGVDDSANESKGASPPRRVWWRSWLERLGVGAEVVAR